MPQDLYLLVYPSHPFADHWALFLPTVTNTTSGLILQVVGDPLTGFQHEFLPNYDYEADSRRPKPKLLSTIKLEENDLSAASTDATATTATTVADDDSATRKAIEAVAAIIEAPGRSLRSAASSDAESRRKVEIKNCQWWVKRVVEKLVEQSLLGTERLEALGDGNYGRREEEAAYIRN